MHFTLMPKGATYPAIVIHGISSTPTVTLDGTANVQERRLQFSCYAADYLSAKNLAKDLKTLLSDYAGTLSDGTVVKNTIFELDYDIPYNTGGDKGFIFGAGVDFTFSFVEA